MDDETREAAKLLGKEIGDKSDVPFSDIDMLQLGIKRGIDLERDNWRQTEAEIEAEHRKTRRDRLICAALSGVCANPSFDLDCHDSVVNAARNKIFAIADAVLARLDAEGNS
jgi:hypothetical protein